MRKIEILYRKITFKFKRIYRSLCAKNASQYAWLELIKFHKSAGWNYGQFDKERYIECGFKVDETNFVDFNYSVKSGKLVFTSTIFKKFDEEITHDVLVLAAHFNGLLSFGVVKVSVKYNYVEFIYAGDVLSYSLFPGEIDLDAETHYKLTQDCFWSFTNLIETGEDPVFVFSEFLRRKDGKKIDSN